jgi:hypothetical protein
VIEPRLIPLRTHDGRVRAYAIVDAADYDWLVQWKWHLASAGYAVRQSSRTAGRQHPIPMHRVLLSLPREDKRQGDHVNGNRLDNRRENLRVVERAENAQNRRSQRGSSSGHRGVAWNVRRQKWYAYARLNGVLHHLGVFDDEDEAARVVEAFRSNHMPHSIEAVA